MKNKKTIFWIIVILILLYWYNARQNAAPQTEKAAETQSKTQTEQTSEVEELTDESVDEDVKDEANEAETTEAEIQTDEAFPLAGEALGNGEVAFSWEFEEELPEDARFVLVRAEMENPELNSTNFWYRVHGSKREAIWKQVPAGRYHFRLCQTDEKDGVCKRYSNDIELQVE